MDAMDLKEKPVVILVDDDVSLVEFGKAYFSAQGYDVYVAINYEEALKLVHLKELGTRLAVAFIDHTLRDSAHTGLDFLKYIRNTASHRVVPYLFTGNESQPFRREAGALGAYRVFVKNVDDWDELEIVANPRTNPLWAVLYSTAEDDLTGLYNFRYFKKMALEVLETLRARTPDETVTLLSIDADHFKTINDTCGHLAGDEVLKTIGAVLKSHMRLSEFVCRKSGDEFLVLRVGGSWPEMQRFAERLREAVFETEVVYRAGEAPIRSTISYGGAQLVGRKIVTAQEGFEKLLHLADKGVHGLIDRRAKERGTVSE